MQQELAIEAIKNIMKMLDITPEQLQDNTQSVTTEKNYTILEFRETGSARKDKVVLHTNNLYGYIDGTIAEWSEDTMLYSEESVNDGSYEIYKVKRNSDNTIFTLGDTAFSPNGSKTDHLIEKFEIRQRQLTKRTYSGIDEMWVKWDKGCGGNWLSAIKLSKQKREVILVTEDGVEIYDENHNVYGLDIDWTNSYTTAKQAIQYPLNGEMWFSSESARKEYINKHKPMYSLNQIKEAYANLPSINELPSWWEFKQCLQ